MRCAYRLDVLYRLKRAANGSAGEDAEFQSVNRPDGGTLNPSPTTGSNGAATLVLRLVAVLT